MSSGGCCKSASMTHDPRFRSSVPGRDDGSAQPADPLAGRRWSDGNASRLVNTPGASIFGRPVVAVVDEDDLRRHFGCDVRKPREKRPDVLDFVLCRHDHR